MAMDLTKNLSNTCLQFRYILMLQRDRLASGNLLRKLKHDSIIIGYWDISRCTLQWIFQHVPVINQHAEGKPWLSLRYIWRQHMLDQITHMVKSGAYIQNSNVVKSWIKMENSKLLVNHYLLHVAISTEVCTCLYSRCTLQWISQLERQGAQMSISSKAKVIKIWTLSSTPT